MNIENLNWMNFSGSPTLFLPFNLRRDWLGFYSEVASDYDGFFDMELNDKSYIINDDFDFENPQTDYDRICAINENHFAYKIGMNYGLVINSFYDYLAWDRENKLFINGKINFIDLEALDTLAWENKIEWVVTNSKIFMMNSCNCVSDEDLDKEQTQLIDLEPGKYRIEMAEYVSKNGFCAYLYKFTLSN